MTLLDAITTVVIIVLVAVVLFVLINTFTGDDDFD